jgi:hypothetical protein
MMQHLETNNILYELQHGFRAKRSCESQIISLIHDLSQNNDKNIQTDLIIMDFAKAFPVSNDLVNNNVRMSVHISIFSFSTLPVMVSGPVALLGFSLIFISFNSARFNVSFSSSENDTHAIMNDIVVFNSNHALTISVLKNI